MRITSYLIRALLLSISIAIIGALQIEDLNAYSYADEVAWIATVFLVVSLVFSFVSGRAHSANQWQNMLAEWSFVVGAISLIAAGVLAAIYL